MGRRLFYVAALSVSLVSLTACSSGARLSQDNMALLPALRNDVALRALRETGAGKITHIVYIVQENRSFDNLFQGYPGADTVSSGKDSSGQTIVLKPVALGVKYVLDHSLGAMETDCDGTGSLPGTDCRMDGFDKELNFGGPKHVKYPMYVFVPHSDSRPYFDMAHEGVLADRMFQSQLDESFVAHQYIIAAQAASSVNLPNLTWGCHGGSDDTVATITQERQPDGPAIRPCYDYQTLGDELDAAKLSWKFYAAAFGSASSDSGSLWSGYQAVKHIRNGPDWKKDVVSPNWRFITDVRGGKLANFTWVTPVCDDSDHVNCKGNYGPSWVAALVNAVGKSRFWSSTVIFIQWDDWGGLYDHAPPPYEDYDGVGFRVPLIVMSPYAREGRVSHVQYETASVLRFAEDLWGLSQLAAADARANSPAKDCFDFSAPPRPFVKIKAPLPPKFFMHNRGGDNYFAPDYE